MKKIWFTIALIGVFCFSTSVFATPNTLIGEWQLVSLNGETVTVPVTLGFPSDEGVATGFGGCNYYNASYYVIGPNEIAFGSISSSLEYCDDTSPLEGIYLETLSSSTQWNIGGNSLTFQDESGMDLLAFSTVESLETTDLLSVMLNDVTIYSEMTILNVIFVIVGLSTAVMIKRIGMR